MPILHLSLLLTALIPTLAQAITLPENFIDESVVAGLTGQITSFEEDSTGRFFIAEKSGMVRIAVDGNVQPQPFLDITDIVNDRVDRGLLSIALHPDFPSQPYVYLLYTYDPPELVTNGFIGPGSQDGNGNRVARLERFTADSTTDYNQAVADSGTVLMGRNSTYINIGAPEGMYDAPLPSCGTINNPVRDCLPIDELSHTIGAMRFASDNSLYVSNGDGASYHSVDALTAMVQDIDSMRGKVFRIDPDTGNGLPDNPFYNGDPGSNRSKVINYGLRNPYSMALQPGTNIPYVGDVGYDLWEEVNGGYAQNFAWPCYSGTEGRNLRRPLFEDLPFCQDFYQQSIELQAPVVSWPTADTGAAMVGDFYSGDVFPEEYRGNLFYADFLQGWLRHVNLDDPANIVKSEFATDMLPMVEMRMGDDGALYYASITTGEVRRIRYAVGVEPPPQVDTNVTGNPAVPDLESSQEPELVPNDNNVQTESTVPASSAVTVGLWGWSSVLLLLWLFGMRQWSRLR